MELVKPDSETAIKSIKNILGNEYQKLKVDEHLRTCGKANFQAFLVFDISDNEV